jgi:alkylated DNA repair dioxygenase AlkB
MEALSLFPELEETQTQRFKVSIQSDVHVSVSRIKGLRYVPGFISESVEQELLERIDSVAWLTELERRVQHYGYKYDYKSRRIDSSMRLGELPDWMNSFCTMLVCAGIFEKRPDQVIVNEYKPGQGISAHIDCEPCFDDTIASLTLNSGCVMDFTDLANTTKVPIYLEPRSLVVLQGDARYGWKHSIPKRIKDSYAGVILERGRRVSLTFRNVKAEFTECDLKTSRNS